MQVMRAKKHFINKTERRAQTSLRPAMRSSLGVVQKPDDAVMVPDNTFLRFVQGIFVWNSFQIDPRKLDLARARTGIWYR